jgi:hypothetical protein
MSRRNLIHHIILMSSSKTKPKQVKDIKVNWKKFRIEVISLIILGLVITLIVKCT